MKHESPVNGCGCGTCECARNSLETRGKPNMEDRNYIPPVKECEFCGGAIIPDWMWGNDINIGRWRYHAHPVANCMRMLNSRIKALEAGKLDE